MKIERIGWRRLYDAIGCSIANGEPYSTTVRLTPTLDGSVYIGPWPRFGITKFNSPSYLVLSGSKTQILDFDHQFNPEKSKHTARFFTEITCWENIEIRDELSKSLWANDGSANQELFALVDKRSAILQQYLDLLAGSLGLRIHQQFVLIPIAENPIVLRQPGADMLQFHGPGMECLKPISLTNQGRAVTSSLLKGIGEAPAEAQENAALVLGWLMRAWRERDPVFQFLSLFIPLEVCLAGVEPEADTDADACISQLRSNLSSSNPEEFAQLSAFLDRAKRNLRPSIASRFEALARHFNLPDWEEHVTAFRRFNRIRNDLIHQGDSKVRLHVVIDENSKLALKDLVEQYVSLKLFGDTQIYDDPWRPRQDQLDQNG